MFSKWSLNTSEKLGFSGLRFFSGSSHFEDSSGYLALKAIFANMPQTSNIKLKQNIISNHLKSAWTNKNRSNSLAERDSKLTKDFPLSEKINQALNLRRQYFANPVLTSHPTEVLSDEVLIEINQLVRTLVCDNSLEVSKLAYIVTSLCKKPWLADEPLSPQDEIKRQDRLYLDMMQEFSSFHETNASLFAKNHGITIIDAKKSLIAANQFAFQHVSSWAVGDLDGNKRRDRHSMETMERGLQLAIIERYMDQIKPLLDSCPSLNASYRYLKRCVRALNDGIYFNLEGALIAKQRLIQELNKSILQDKPENDICQKIEALQDFIDIVGFRGSLKQFVRQSSKANAEVFNNFAHILASKYPEILNLMDTDKHYKNWPEVAKRQFHSYLRTDSCYFRSLREAEGELLRDTIRELDILDFVHDYSDQFDYILSDTQSYTSLDEVIILFAFSRYRQNRLAIDEIKCPPVNLIPLCETPEDLIGLPEILNNMLHNPYLKQVIIQKQELIYVAGPSDLGKEGGLFAHINLVDAEKNAQNVLFHHQSLDVRLAPVRLRVLYGLGGDMHRRVAEASAQLFSTFQGAEACGIGAPFAFKAHVERVTGMPSENTFRAQELSLISKKNPQAFELLKKMVDQCVHAYRQYTFHPAGLALFRALTISDEIGRLTNTSSRAESKTAKAKDITQSRAIGITNYDLASPLMTRIIMSAHGLTNLSSEFLPYLPTFFQESITVQEQILKILFALAVADEKRAWHKLLGKMPTKLEIDLWADLFKINLGDNNPIYALAYVHRQIPEILKNLANFLPGELCHQAQVELEQMLIDCSSYQEVTLKLLALLGQTHPVFKNLKQEIEFDLWPRYQMLASLIDSYDSKRSVGHEEELSELRENIVLALRGDRRIAQGPLCIAELKSALAFDYQHHLDKKFARIF